MSTSTGQDLYRIGTVASLTGIAVERLRAWERRYGLEPAHKTGRTRFYSRQQVDQLALIKRLVDQGDTISSVANLSIEQLQARLQDNQHSLTVLPASAPQIGLIGPNLMVLEQRSNTSQRVDVQARWANMESFAQDHSGANEVDIIFAQLPVLSLQPIDFINNIYPDCKVIAVYQFATEDAVASLEAADVSVVKWPVTCPELEHMAIVERGLAAPAAGLAARSFSDEELIAMAVATDDPSQRLPQLIELIQQTNAYISFASTSHPQNDSFSALAAHVSTARSQLEAALEQLNKQLLEEYSEKSVQNMYK